MCDCTSCSYTDSFAGWCLERARDGTLIPDASLGFAGWPKGEPKGSVTSAAEYRKHATHCGSAGLPKPWRFVPGQPPKFSTVGLTMPIPQAPKFVLDYIRSLPMSPPRQKRVPSLVALARELRRKAA